MTTLKKSKTNKKNIAICIGDMDKMSPLLTGFCGTLDYNNCNTLMFADFSREYHGEIHDTGEVNIFNLPNFDIIDALAIMPIYLSENWEIINPIIERAKKSNIPILSIGEKIDGCYSIAHSFEQNIHRLCNHFIEHHGFTRINFIAGKKGMDISESRLKAYCDALEQHGIPVEQERIAYGDFWYEPAYRAVDSFLDSDLPLPQAIVCANDTMALAACRQLAERGFGVPDDICVSGIDGIDEALNYVTTAKLYDDQAGAYCAEKLLRILRGEETNIDDDIPTQIILGETCGCGQDANADFLLKRHRLYDQIEILDRNTNSLIRQIQNLNNCMTLAQVKDRLLEFAKLVWCKKLWICVCDGLIRNVESIDDATAMRNDFCRKGYPEKMEVLVHVDNHEEKPCVFFNTSEMLPDFYNQADRCEYVVFVPLHFQDMTIGYLAMDFFPWSTDFQLFNLLAMGISNVLENVRKQNELLLFAKKIDELYVTDPLTKLYNRRGFYQMYEQRVKNDCINVDAMVISIDLDLLKIINDNYGHNEGDNAIITTANALLAASINKEICARFGGDEYVVFGVGVTAEYAESFCKRVDDYLDDYNLKSGKPYKVHASFGICLIPKGKLHHIDSFIKQADEKMYDHKASNKHLRETPRR